MNKEHYIAAHERLVAEMMDRTGCDWQTAYDATGDKAYDAMREDLADRADHLRQLRKDQGL